MYSILVNHCFFFPLTEGRVLDLDSRYFVVWFDEGTGCVTALRLASDAKRDTRH